LAGVHRDTLLRWLREGFVREPKRDRRGWRVFSPEETQAVIQFARSGQADTAELAPPAYSPELDKLDHIDWNFVDAKTTYLTHGLHPYPAKFIPQIPNALIQALSSVGETVADIFCGSGTTLVEALVLKRNAIGIDANPLACLITEGKTLRLTPADSEAVEQLTAKASSIADTMSDGQYSLFNGSGGLGQDAPRPNDQSISFWFEPFVIDELAEILAWCRALPTESSRRLAEAAFSSIVVAVSKQDSDTRYVRRDKNIRPGDALRRFSRSLQEALVASKQFTELVEPRFTCKVLHANLLQQPETDQFDLVVCSPPYPNAYSYHLYHMTRMLWLGMDPHGFKKIEIGSHRKYSRKGPNRAGVETFRAEMGTIFDWLRCHLRPNRYACFVVGDSILDGKKVNNAELLSADAREHGFVEVKRIHRHLQESRKAFNPAYGKIKTEHVVILQNRMGVDIGTGHMQDQTIHPAI